MVAPFGPVGLLGALHDVGEHVPCETALPTAPVGAKGTLVLRPALLPLFPLPFRHPTPLGGSEAVFLHVLPAWAGREGRGWAELRLRGEGGRSDGWRDGESGNEWK